MKKKGFSITISFGKYGGFYNFSGYGKRICLGWLAITYYPEDIDEILKRLTKTPNP